MPFQLRFLYQLNCWHKNHTSTNCHSTWLGTKLIKRGNNLMLSSCLSSLLCAGGAFQDEKQSLCNAEFTQRFLDQLVAFQTCLQSCRITAEQIQLLKSIFHPSAPFASPCSPDFLEVQAGSVPTVEIFQVQFYAGMFLIPCFASLSAYPAVRASDLSSYCT